MLYSSIRSNYVLPCKSDDVELFAVVLGIVEFDTEPSFIVVLEVVSSEWDKQI